MVNSLNRNPIYWFSAGTIIRQLVSFIMLPIYTNYLTPADYGVIALLTVIMAAYELFLGAQFGRALPKFYYDKDSVKGKDSVAITALTITIIGSSLGVLAFFFSAPLISEHGFENPGLTPVVALYSTMILTTAVESYVLILIRLKNHPALFFLMSVCKLVVQLSLNIYTVVILEMSVVGVMYSAVLSSILFAGISLLYTVRNCSLAFDASLVKPLFVFTWPLWLAGGGNVYVGISTNYFIKEFTSLAEVGIYFLGAKFCIMMSMFVWRPFSEWWQTERFKIIKDETQHFRFRLIYAVISYVLCFAAVGLSTGGAAVLKVMVNESFYLTFSILFVLAFDKIFFHLTQIYYLPMLHVGKTTLIARVSLIRAVLNTLVLVPAIWYFGLQGAVVGLLIVSIVVMLIIRFNANKCFKLDVDFWKSKFMIALSFVFAWGASQVIDLNQSVFDVLVSSTLSFGLYAMVLLFLFYIDRNVREFVLQLVFKKR